MKDPRVEKLAKVMVQYSGAVKKGDLVLIQGGQPAIPLLKEIYKETLLAGGNPVLNVYLDEASEMKFKYATDEQLQYVPEFQVQQVKTVDVFFQVLGEENTRSMSGIDASRMRISAAARKEINNIFMDRAGKGEMRWSLTQFPTQADAQEASMSLTEYEDFIYEACGMNEEDPVVKWMKMKEEQDKLCKMLNEKKQIRIVSKGTDITMSVEGRTWINCCGHENFPDGEVFTGPVENSVNGEIRFSFPGIYNGKEIEDIRLSFKDGKVVDAKASKGEELLKQLLEVDEGARFLGELGIGTNYGINKFTRNMLFDEKIGGTVHLAIGAAYPESGSKNESSIHWDMLCDMREGGEMYADGQLIYKDGKFLL